MRDVSDGDYLLGVARLVLLVAPAGVACRFVRARVLSLPVRSLSWLVDVILTVGALVVGAEVLGVLGIDRWWTLTLVIWVGGLFAAAAVRRYALEVVPETGAGDVAGPDEARRPAVRRLWLGLAAAAMAVVGGQWVLLTSDAHGGGILSFDSLWYHLPFAAFFAQTGSVSRVLFTQADPFVAYYPANSELLHTVGLLAMGSDLLSPMLNLVWLAVALLAAWCFGRPWRIEPVTLTAGCLIMGVPILAAGQPGSAFNDIFGLAFLMAAVALTAQPSSRSAGLVGVTGGWWYLRAALDTGNPLGLRVHIGPLVLPGPRSPLADAASQTVISALTKPDLWSSRLAPGLNSPSARYGPCSSQLRSPV